MLQKINPFKVTLFLSIAPRLETTTKVNCNPRYLGFKFTEKDSAVIKNVRIQYFGKKLKLNFTRYQVKKDPEQKILVRNWIQTFRNTWRCQKCQTDWRRNRWQRQSDGNTKVMATPKWWQHQSDGNTEVMATLQQCRTTNLTPESWRKVRLSTHQS